MAHLLSLNKVIAAFAVLVMLATAGLNSQASAEEVKSSKTLIHPMNDFTIPPMMIGW